MSHGHRAALLVAWLTLESACGRPVLPTASVERGEFIEWLQVRGEVKAARSLTLRAPPAAGDLRIVSIAASGTRVTKGSVIAEFDTSTVKRTLDEKRTEVNGLQAEIDKARAEAGTKEAERLTAESTARFDVERARLDYSGKDALSAVEAEQRRLKILNAEHKLREATATLASARAEARANLAAALQKKERALQEMERAARQMAVLRVVASSEGLLTIMPNPRGPFFQRQPFKPGDQVWPGAELAQLPDLSSLYVLCRLDEVERGRLSVEQDVSVRIEGLPDRELAGTVQAISALARTDFGNTWPPPRNFDVSIALSDRDPRVRPGMTATVRVVVDRLRDVLLVPSESVFERSGESVVYVVTGTRHEPRSVQVERRSDQRVVVTAGLKQGERVSLVDPSEPPETSR